ncbi:MAG: hypothetical protein ACE368_02230 [Paracoccaceae bacterium]
MPDSARDIYQTNLDRVSLALWTRNLPMLLRHLAIPNRMTTLDAEIVMGSPEEVEVIMHDLRDHLERIGAEWYERRCLEADFVPVNPDMILGKHVTIIHRGGQHLVEPYVSHMTLMRIGGRWQGTSCDTDGHNDKLHVIAKDMAEGQRREHQARSKAADAPRPSGGARKDAR